MHQPSYSESLSMAYESRKTAARALILSNQEYAQTAFAKDPVADVYAYQFKQGDKKIVFHGVPHTNQLRHPLFLQIETAFVAAHPDMVYVEGYTNLAERSDDVRASLQTRTFDQTKLEGESQFTLKLAVEANVDFASPEPKFHDEIAALVSAGYTKADIYQFYQYRIIAQYQREYQKHEEERTDESCRQYLQPFLQQFAVESEWDTEELAVFKSQLFAELAVDKVTAYKQLVTPVPVNGKFESVLNEISAFSSDYRDIYIFNQLADGLQKYHSLFIVYGSAHAVRLEPALRALLQGED